jgi:hypothetical protein
MTPVRHSSRFNGLPETVETVIQVLSPTQITSLKRGANENMLTQYDQRGLSSSSPLTSSPLS